MAATLTFRFGGPPDRPALVVVIRAVASLAALGGGLAALFASGVAAWPRLVGAGAYLVVAYVVHAQGESISDLWDFMPFDPDWTFPG